MESSALIEAWRASINGAGKSWVLFENGTCVVLMEPKSDLATQATALLQEFGPVHPASSFGDFGTIALVLCHVDSDGWYSLAIVG